MNKMLRLTAVLILLASSTGCGRLGLFRPRTQAVAMPCAPACQVCAPCDTCGCDPCACNNGVMYGGEVMGAPVMGTPTMAP